MDARANAGNLLKEKAQKDFDKSNFDNYFRSALSEYGYAWSIYPPFNTLKTLFKDLPKSEYKEFGINLYLALSDSKNLSKIVNALNAAADAWAIAEKEKVSPSEFVKSNSIKELNAQLSEISAQSLSHQFEIKQLRDKISGMTKIIDTSTLSNEAKLKQIQAKGEGPYFERLFDYLNKARESLLYTELGRDMPTVTLWSLFKNRAIAVTFNSDIAIGNTENLVKEIEKLEDVRKQFVDLKETVLSKTDFTMANFKKALEKLIDGFPHDVSKEQIIKRIEELNKFQAIINKYPELSKVFSGITFFPKDELPLIKGAEILDQLKQIPIEKLTNRDVDSMLKQAKLSDDIEKIVSEAVKQQVQADRKNAAMLNAVEMIKEIKNLAKVSNENVATVIYKRLAQLKSAAPEVQEQTKKAIMDSITTNNRRKEEGEKDFKSWVKLDVINIESKLADTKLMEKNVEAERKQEEKHEKAQQALLNKAIEKDERKKAEEANRGSLRGGTSGIMKGLFGSDAVKKGAAQTSSVKELTAKHESAIKDAQEPVKSPSPGRGRSSPHNLPEYKRDSGVILEKKKESSGEKDVTERRGRERSQRAELSKVNHALINEMKRGSSIVLGEKRRKSSSDSDNEKEEDRSRSPSPTRK